MNRYCAKGLTMIEVLVVLVILSIGLLGVAGLQITSIRQTANSGMQTQAMILAGDLVERIRTNRGAIVQGNQMTITMANYGKAVGVDLPATAIATCTTSSGCTPESMADNDLYEWGVSISNSLPVTSDILKNNTYICLDSNTADATVCDGLGSTVVIQIAWQDSTEVVANGQLDDSTNIHTYQMVFEP
ncbi:MAG: type IV pilus modification protein PilV [Hahellaceae bacterium]|nr:type IV pilus modification protein PilV [Hahellaceae bacterium]